MSLPTRGYAPAPLLSEYPSQACLRAYCFVLSQEVLRYFPLRTWWWERGWVRVDVTLHMGKFRAIADGFLAPDEWDKKAIIMLLRHFASEPQAVLAEEDYVRFWPPTAQ